MNARDIYNTWCSRTDLTDSERAELAQMANDEIAITKAFGAKLHFGTAGLRGIMGLGPKQALPNGSWKPTKKAAPSLFPPIAV